MIGKNGGIGSSSYLGKFSFIYLKHKYQILRLISYVSFLFLQIVIIIFKQLSFSYL